MKLSDQLQEAVRLDERIEDLSSDTVKKLRSDFLILIGNVKRVRSYDDAEKLRAGVRVWRDRLNDLLTQVQNDVRERRYDKPMQPAVNAREVDSLIKSLGPAWTLQTELMNFPLRRYDPAMEQWWPKSAIFAEYGRDVSKWEARVKRLAPAAWKALDYAAGWATRFVGGSTPIKVKHVETENISVAGFKVQLVGFEGDQASEMIAAMEPALGEYRSRAMKIMPILIKRQLPIVIAADDERGNEAAAEYHDRFIKVTTWGHASRRTPRDFVKTMAHEMGHHIFRTVLSGQATSDWEEFIRGGKTQLDLRDLVKALRKYGEDDVWSIDEKLQADNPILALQFAGLYHDPKYRQYDLVSSSRIQAYLDSGRDPVVYVDQAPVTGYAAKNPEEAFCEAVGMLVAYGPRTVLPEVAAMLRRIVPELRVESKH